MASNFSKPFWEFLSPPLNYLQFPWRFLTLASFFGVICCSYLIYYTSPLKDKILVIFLLIVPLITWNHNYFQPVGYNFVAEYTVDDPCGTAGWSNEYIPVWVKKCFPEGTDLEIVNVTKGDIKIKALQINKSSRLIEFNTESTQSGKLLFKKYYFPGWKLKIDGQSSSISPSPPYGLIEASIPMDNHKIQLVFKNTPLRNIANIISIIGLLICIWLFFRILRPYLFK